MVGLVLGFFMLVVVPLVWMLLHHQRKMAEFLHRQAQQPEPGRIEGLESEVRELKERVNQLILMQEDRRSLQERVGPPPLHDRQ